MNGEDDPLDELHRVREQIWREAGGTWEGLFAYIKRREAERSDRTVIEPPPAKVETNRKGEVA